MPFPLPPHSAFSMQGSDALKFAHRMFSRNIESLRSSDGAMTAFLSAEGKVLEFFWVILRDTELILIAPSERIDGLKALIERYHFAENFRLGPTQIVDSSWSTSDQGHGKGRLAGDQFLGTWRGTNFHFDLKSARPDQTKNLDIWEKHRIEQLIPQWQSDFDQSTFVFDVGFEELCDPGKGCYIGQEVVERVRTRGNHFPRRLTLFAWSNRPRAEMAVANSRGEVIGATTHSIIESDGRFLSLGFTKRNAAATGDEIVIQESQTRGEILRIFALQATETA
jgi:folate-binding protein YgfZ